MGEERQRRTHLEADRSTQYPKGPEEEGLVVCWFRNKGYGFVAPIMDYEVAECLFAHSGNLVSHEDWTHVEKYWLAKHTKVAYRPMPYKWKMLYDAMDVRILWPDKNQSDGKRDSQRTPRE